MTENLFQRFAGRRKGRPLRRGRADTFSRGDILIPAAVMDHETIDPTLFFTSPQKNLWVEIGFGNGEHLAEQARCHSTVDMIGCEPFLNGVSMAIKNMEKTEIGNIRIWADEALAFLAKFPDACIDRLFLLFSDPWPKTRQQKRRVVQPETVKLFARILKSGGILRLATDHRHLAEWMLLHVAADENLIWQQAQNGDWDRPPNDWVETRYQQKAAQQGRRSYFMDFMRR